jgi:hypothetical protein
MLPRIALASILLVTFATAARGETVTLTSVRDNTLFEDATGSLSSGSGTDMFCGKITVGSLRRAVVAFDVSSLPTDAVIDSVRLELHLSRSADLSPRLIRVYRVLSDWGEGASVSSQGEGAPSQAGDATWLHTFFPNSFWSKPGGDFAGVASDSLTVLGAADYVWNSPGLASDVHAWTSQILPNFGWILIGEESVPTTARAFNTREGAIPPRLVIHYSITTDVKPMTWGKIKQLYR